MSVRSQAQLTASQDNGAKSQGPKTEEGKAVSSKNAIRHGLCCKDLVFDDPEAAAEFEKSFVDLCDTYHPTTEPERICVREMAVANWRAGVVLRMEIALIQAVDRREACCETGGQGLPSLKTILRYKARIDRDYDRARAELQDLRQHRLPPQMPIGPTSRPALDEAFMARDMNEPEPPANSASPANDVGLNREQRRRLEAVNRKKSKK